MISLLRCDDRLIHGQAMIKVVKAYEAKAIIVVDDYTATNNLIKRIFMSALPKDMNAYPVTLADCADKINEAITNDIPTIVLMRFPHTMVEIYEKCPGLQKDYNIATVVAEHGDINVAKGAKFNQTELDAVKKLSDMGVHVWFNLFPGDEITEWDSIKENY